MGIWDFGGSPVVQLLGARGSVDQPQFAEPSAADLYACANGRAPYTNGYPLPDGQTLDTAACSNLLYLDPFWAAGQGTRFSLQPEDPRAIGVGGTDYGMDPAGSGSDLNVSFSQTTAWKAAQTNSGNQTYSADVTDVVGNTSSAGLTLDEKAPGGINVGLSAGVTLKEGESTTTTNSWKITFKNSTAVSQQNTTQITGTMDDHNASLGYRPHVNFFVDKLFGGYMFQDPTAPVKPLPINISTGPQNVVVTPIAPNKISPVLLTH
jgi:hypothetical protein